MFAASEWVTGQQYYYDTVDGAVPSTIVRVEGALQHVPCCRIHRTKQKEVSRSGHHKILGSLENME